MGRCHTLDCASSLAAASTPARLLPCGSGVADPFARGEYREGEIGGGPAIHFARAASRQTHRDDQSAGGRGRAEFGARALADRGEKPLPSSYVVLTAVFLRVAGNHNGDHLGSPLR